jgi:hypothetical protein
MFSAWRNPGMLAALAAMAIPLIIQWLFRLRRRRIAFPAMRYLMDKKKRQRVKLQDRLLLVVRTVVPGLLVIAPARPTGAHTQPGDALVDVLRDLSGNTIAGMVMISDGRSTATPQSGAVTLDEAARRLRQAKVPVSTIATGTAEPLRDLALVDLTAPKEANLDDTLNLRLTVVNHIEPDLQAALTLLEDGKPQVVRKVRLRAGRNDITLSMIVVRVSDLVGRPFSPQSRSARRRNPPRRRGSSARSSFRPGPTSSGSARPTSCSPSRCPIRGRSRARKPRSPRNK